MSKQNLSTRVSALETTVGVMSGDVSEIKAMLTSFVTASKVPTTPKAGKAKAPKASTKAVVTEAAEKPISLTVVRLRLKEHKAAGLIRAGISAKEAIAEGLMNADGSLPGKGKKSKAPKATAPAAKKVDTRTPEQIEAYATFKAQRISLAGHKATGAIAKGVTVKQALAEGLMDEDGFLLCEHGLAEVEVCAEVQEKSTKAERKAAKKARKLAAVVEAEAPARFNVASVAPRRADGTITPKSEWALRERLADSGKFDRHEIDAIVASQA